MSRNTAVRRFVVEVESVPATGDWELRTDVTGSLGKGYHEWKHGSKEETIDSAGSGVLAYPIRISTPGSCRFRARSAAPHSTEHNDVWAQFADSDGLFWVQGSDEDGPHFDWTKVYQNRGGDNWSWNASTVDHEPHELWVHFDKAGDYTVELSGRSNLFKIDRWSLAVDGVDGTDDKLPESSRAP